jgi:hypothetical protein
MMTSFFNDRALPPQQSGSPFGNDAPNRAGPHDKEIWIFHFLLKVDHA